MYGQSKWNGRYWGDLAERVLSTFLGALLGLVVAGQVANLTPNLAWTILGVPTAVSLLKGLLANMVQGETGASLLPPPAGPEVTPQV